jgi:hypothetical protein
MKAPKIIALALGLGLLAATTLASAHGYRSHGYYAPPVYGYVPRPAWGPYYVPRPYAYGRPYAPPRRDYGRPAWRDGHHRYHGHRHGGGYDGRGYGGAWPRSGFSFHYSN